MTIELPELSLVLLIGPSGSGKSTFARHHFTATEILSSDFFRGMVADDPGEQRVSGDAFELLHIALDKRLKHARLTVIDATNLKPSSRAKLFEIAKKYHCPVFAIVLDLPLEICLDQNAKRPDRVVPTSVIEHHFRQFEEANRVIDGEEFRSIFRLRSLDTIAEVKILRSRLSFDQRKLAGPFDIIGDVHGCLDELLELLHRLGYRIQSQTQADGTLNFDVQFDHDRTVIFVGDLVDRGPRVADVLRLVMRLTEAGRAYCVMGNHDFKLYRKLIGKDVQISHGLAETLQQFERESPEFLDSVRRYFETLPYQLVLDGGNLVVAHAGMKAELQGRNSDRVRAFALYGETTGEVDEYGLPIRGNWWKDYRGNAFVVYGHTPINQPEWINRCLCIDTACVFGIALTALRYPEMDIVRVPAKRVYAETKRPIPPTISQMPVKSNPPETTE